MSSPAFATLASDGSTVQFNLDQIVTVTPNPQVLGGPNTYSFTDGSTLVVVERYQDVAGAAT